MTNGRRALTSYLAAALRVGGPWCEKAFLAEEERRLLRGTRAEALGPLGEPHGPGGPRPFPAALALSRRIMSTREARDEGRLIGKTGPAERAA